MLKFADLSENNIFWYFIIFVRFRQLQLQKKITYKLV